MCLCFSDLWKILAVRGRRGCQIHAFQGMVSILAAISFLAAIAWDRYHQYCTSEYKREHLPYIKSYCDIFQGIFQTRLALGL